MPGSLIVERNVLEWRFDPASDARLPEATGYDVDVIVLCSEGYTSSLAADALRSLGLHRATDVVGSPVGMWRTRRGLATLALCLVRTQPCAAAAAPSRAGAAPAAPGTVSEAATASAATTTLRDRRQPRRMAGSLLGVVVWHEDPGPDVDERAEHDDRRDAEDPPDERVEVVAAGEGGEDAGEDAALAGP